MYLIQLNYITLKQVGKILNTETKGDVTVSYVYLPEEPDWYKSLPSENWMGCFICNNTVDRVKLSGFAETCLSNNCVNVHLAGKESKALDYSFDKVRAETKNKNNLHVITACWDENIADAFWNSIYMFDLDEEYGLNELVCISIDGENIYNDLVYNIKLFNNYWSRDDYDDIQKEILTMLRDTKQSSTLQSKIEEFLDDLKKNIFTYHFTEDKNLSDKENESLEISALKKIDKIKRIEVWEYSELSSCLRIYYLDDNEKIIAQIKKTDKSTVWEKFYFNNDELNLYIDKSGDQHISQLQIISSGLLKEYQFYFNESKKLENNINIEKLNEEH
jgi:hypothetical protein